MLARLASSLPSATSMLLKHLSGREPHSPAPAASVVGLTCTSITRTTTWSNEVEQFVAHNPRDAARGPRTDQASRPTSCFPSDKIWRDADLNKEAREKFDARMQQMMEQGNISVEFDPLKPSDLKPSDTKRCLYRCEGSSAVYARRPRAQTCAGGHQSLSRWLTRPPLRTAKNRAATKGKKKREHTVLAPPGEQLPRPKRARQQQQRQIMNIAAGAGSHMIS
jgi:hypothetical protein